jgi:hypothetical protein
MKLFDFAKTWITLKFRDEPFDGADGGVESTFYLSFRLRSALRR